MNKFVSFEFSEPKEVTVLFLPDTFDLADILRAIYMENRETMDNLEAYNAAMDTVKAGFCYVEGERYPVFADGTQEIWNLVPHSGIAPFMIDTECEENDKEANYKAGFVGINMGGRNVAAATHRGIRTDVTSQLETFFCEADGTYSVKASETNNFFLDGVLPKYIPVNTVMVISNICVSNHAEAPVNTAEIKLEMAWRVMEHITPDYIDRYRKVGVWPPFPVPETPSFGPAPLTRFDGGNFLNFIPDLPEHVRPYMDGMFQDRYYDPNNTRPWNYVNK